MNIYDATPATMNSLNATLHNVPFCAADVLRLRLINGITPSPPASASPWATQKVQNQERALSDSLYLSRTPAKYLYKARVASKFLPFSRNLPAAFGRYGGKYHSSYPVSLPFRWNVLLAMLWSNEPTWLCLNFGKRRGAYV